MEVYFYSVNKNKSIKNLIKAFIGMILFLWMSYSIYHQLQRQNDLQETLKSIYTEWGSTKILLSVLVLSLMPINWLVEAMKWRTLLQNTEKLKLADAFKSVLTGVAVSVVTPNRIGEYMGRILYLKNVNKLKGITVTIIGSFAQLIVTGFFGLLGLVYYIINIKYTSWLSVLLISSILLCAILGYFYFHLSVLLDWVDKFSFLRKLKIYIEVIKRYDAKTLWQILWFSVLRYFIYTCQLLLLFYITEVDVMWLSLVFVIWLIYWAMAIVPTIAIAEIGIRGETALYFLLPLSDNRLGIISSSVLLWVINLIIPALLGCIFVYQIKIYDDD